MSLRRFEFVMQYEKVRIENATDILHGYAGTNYCSRLA